MYAGYHRTSLENFLEIIDLGKSLRVKSITYKQKINNKGTKVAKVVESLRQKQANILQQREEDKKKKKVKY